MSDSDFAAWLAEHLRLTGAQSKGDVAETLLTAKSIITGQAWGATAAELREVSRRLVTTGRVPGFPDEHIKAIGSELLAMRRDRAAHRAAPQPVSCHECGGTGWVVVPMPRCVWNGRLVTYVRDGVDYGRIMTCAVTCDDCDAGRRERDAEASRANREQAAGRERRQRPTFLQYTAMIGGVDGTALLREYERDRAEEARRDEKPGERFGDLFPALTAILRRSQSQSSAA